MLFGFFSLLLPSKGRYDLFVDFFLVCIKNVYSLLRLIHNFNERKKKHDELVPLQSSNFVWQTFAIFFWLFFFFQSWVHFANVRWSMKTTLTITTMVNVQKSQRLARENMALPPSTHSNVIDELIKVHNWCRQTPVAECIQRNDDNGVLNVDDNWLNALNGRKSRIISQMMGSVCRYLRLLKIVKRIWRKIKQQQQRRRRQETRWTKVRMNVQMYNVHYMGETIEKGNNTFCIGILLNWERQKGFRCWMCCITLCCQTHCSVTHCKPSRAHLYYCWL